MRKKRNKEDHVLDNACTMNVSGVKSKFTNLKYIEHNIIIHNEYGKKHISKTVGDMKLHVDKLKNFNKNLSCPLHK